MIHASTGGAEAERAVTEGASAPPEWKLATKLAFRFAFAYLVINNFPFPLDALPFTDHVSDFYQKGCSAVTAWTARHILHIDRPVVFAMTGSGDKLYNYVQMLCFLGVAMAVMLVWSALDRRRANYRKLHDWLMLYVRLSLGAVLLNYGAYKVIPSQFPEPFLRKYMQTFGESSPMGLLWAFMRASRAYTIFAGSVEMLGGVLLYMPRTALLGALVSIVSMTQVFLLNMCYDVPVKLYSFHLLMMGVFLLLPEMGRLAGFFVLNRPTTPAPPRPFFQRAWANRTLLVAQLVLGVVIAVDRLHDSRVAVQKIADYLLKPPVYGAWLVDEFSVNGQARPPLMTDDLQWHRAIFDAKLSIVVQGMDGAMRTYGCKWDETKRTVTFGGAKLKGELGYTTPSSNTLVLQGQLDGQNVRIKMHRQENAFLLKSRGFHWITETPYSR